MEAEDIMEYEIRKRQDWIQKYKEEHNGKPPDKMDKYDDRLFSGDPLTAEELAALEEGAGEKGSKKADKGKKADKAKKDGKKKKDENDTEGVYKKITVGPTEVVLKFEQFYEDYESVWGKRDELDNL